MRRFWILDFGFGIGHRVRFKAKGARSIFTSPRRNCRAFTLIELIGVMAIIGILSAVVLPSLISKIEDANSVGEDANLEEVARALVAGIKATGTIPNPNLNPVLVPGNPPTWTPSGSWTAIAANYCSLIGYSLFNTLPANNQRQIVLSQGLANYVVANLNSYATDADGWPDPIFNDLKIYILASSKSGLPLQANIPVADIANWTKVFDATTGTVTVPESVFGAANTTKGEFLHVKVVDLNQLFCRVELTDTAAPEIVLNFSVPVGGGGGGYSANSTAQVNYGDNKLNFITDGSGNVVAGTKPTFSQCSEYNIRHVAVLGNTITGGTAVFDAPASPNAPTFDLISTAGPGTGTFVASQTVSIYVIKGRPINLFNGLGVLDKSLTIQSDVQLRYYNNSWTRVD
jgi:prepilin-type N-terminal cleavage/methylation domain-containing protein